MYAYFQYLFTSRRVLRNIAYLSLMLNTIIIGNNDASFYFRNSYVTVFRCGCLNFGFCKIIQCPSLILVFFLSLISAEEEKVW